MRKLTLGYQSRTDHYQDQLRQHWPFLESTLGVPVAEMVAVDVTLRFEDLFIQEYLPSVPISGPSTPANSAALVQRWEVTPSDKLPIVDLRPSFPPNDHDGEAVQWQAHWGNQPVAVWLHGVRMPVVFVRLPFCSASLEGTTSCDLLIARRSAVGEALAVVAKLMKADLKNKKRIYVPNGPDQSFLPNNRWDDLVLDPQVSRLICSDFRAFLERREWFEANRIPYRRGYLLHGSPGNGKTSLVRMMASDPRLSATTLQWGDSDADDDALDKMFRWASDHAPAMVIMEDLDRHFSYSTPGEQRHRITMARLLNCLDGIGTTEGVIVVATANDPSKLDPAILSRPGRFDRVVELKRPSAELRATYIQTFLREACGQADLEQMVATSAGFSFAQLRECYILAGQFAFDHAGVVTARDMVEAIDQLAAATPRPKKVGAYKKEVGFVTLNGSAAQ